METATTAAQTAEPAPLWDATHGSWRVAIFGAGGAVGRELAGALLAAGHQPSRLSLYARTSRTVEWRGERLVIEPLPLAPPRSELAFLCLPPQLASDLAPLLASRGTRVVDLSGGLRRNAQVPLVLDEISAEGLGAFTDMVALPRRSTALIAPPLALLDRTVGLAEVDLFCILSAASGGARGMLSLRAEMAELGKRGGVPAFGETSRAGNLHPALATHDGLDAEREIGEELRRLLRRPDLLLDVSAVEADLERCDAFAVKLILHGELSPQSAGQILSRSGAIQVEWDERGPIPANCAGSPRVHVGRIRSGSRGGRSLCFFAAGDQLRAGAVQAALRVAARLPAAA